MSSDFVTIAKFNRPDAADRAKSRLQAAGIFSLLVEREQAGPNWHVEKEASVVNLLVAPEDEDRAVEILNRPELDAEQKSQAVAAERLSSAQPEVADAQSPDLVSSSREALVNRAFKSQIISIIFWPLQLYALYCIVMVARSPQPLSEKWRRRYVMTIFIHCFWWVFVLLFAGLLRLPRL